MQQGKPLPISKKMMLQGRPRQTDCKVGVPHLMSYWKANQTTEKEKQEIRLGAKLRLPAATKDQQGNPMAAGSQCPL